MDNGVFLLLLLLPFKWLSLCLCYHSTSTWPWLQLKTTDHGVGSLFIVFFLSITCHYCLFQYLAVVYNLSLLSNCLVVFVFTLDRAFFHLCVFSSLPPATPPVILANQNDVFLGSISNFIFLPFLPTIFNFPTFLFSLFVCCCFVLLLLFCCCCCFVVVVVLFCCCCCCCFVLLVVLFCFVVVVLFCFVVLFCWIWQRNPFLHSKGL